MVFRLAPLAYFASVAIAAQMSPLWLKMAFAMALTGFSAQMGLFPLHTVAVDAHIVAPPPISAFISTILMNVEFIGIFRVFSVVTQSPVGAWAQRVLLIAALISIFLSAL